MKSGVIDKARTYERNKRESRSIRLCMYMFKSSAVRTFPQTSSDSLIRLLFVTGSPEF